MSNLPILLFDDDPDVTAFEQVALDSLPCESIATHDFESFKAALSKGPVALIVLDLAMPEHDGVQAIRFLAEEQITAPVLIFSSMPQEVIKSAASVAKLRGLNVAGWLRKPCWPEEYGNLVRSVLAAEAGDPFSAQNVAELLQMAGTVEMRYQPKVNLDWNRVDSVEALLRLRHPQLGLVSPGQFMARIESTSEVLQMNNLVVDRVFDDMRSWADLDCTPKVAINTSAKALESSSLLDNLMRASERHAISLSRIMIEITENSLSRLHVDALDAMTRLRLNEVTVSLDDYGVGHATKDRLLGLPFNELKVDRSLLARIQSDPDERANINKLLATAKERGIATVAEGVEDEESLQRARNLGFQMAQGFIFGKPVPAHRLPQALKQAETIARQAN